MFLSNERAKQLYNQAGGPVFVYDRVGLKERAKELMGLDMPFGLTVRYAVKANSFPEIIKLFDAEGLHFDASSGYEADMLMDLGVNGSKISLSSQQSAHNLPELLKKGVRYVATSMHQLELFSAAAGEGTEVALRINPGVGDGHSNRTNTGGVTSSYGIWYEYLDKALGFAKHNRITINRLHLHIGSGADRSIWANVMDIALDLLRQMPEVTMLDIGGGYKVSRAAHEHETDMRVVGEVFAEKLQVFYDETGRQIKLEIEPGNWLVTHAGILLAEVVDIVDTGEEGYNFLRLNTGMNDFIRAAMFGAWHELIIMNDSKQREEYVVVGHCCESSDVFTTVVGNPELIEPRLLNKASIGDLIAILDTGSYCAHWSTKGYNSFPSAKEVLI